MHTYLTKDERDQILDTLNHNQRDFLLNYLRRGMATYYTRKLASELRDSSSDTTDDLQKFMNDWDFVQYIDAGENWRAAGLRCTACNAPLRYQYTLVHRHTGRTVHYGKEHLERHTGLPAHVVKDIKREIGAVDFELDELLRKIKGRWTLGLQVPPNFEWPSEMKPHIELDLPLLDRHVSKIHHLLGQLSNYKVPRNHGENSGKSGQHAAYTNPNLGIRNVSQLEANRRQGKRRADNTEQRHHYYVELLNRRPEWQKSASISEQEMFTGLLCKHGYDIESLPGIFGLDLGTHKTCNTPSHIWQLWVYDRFIKTNGSRTFTSQEAIDVAESEGAIRTSSFEWFYDTMAQYLRVLEDLGIIIYNEANHFYQSLEHELPHIGLKDNILLKMCIEGRTRDDTTLTGYKNSVRIVQSHP